ncbi:hypothetical protein [Traorella massiliensis]|uniref:hypothetical protein n=1 Tax=Traorella massiliensis TaxID=1903263 RepID=UPI0008F952A2|nr:hypothetical protein [Traorella massiliensis]
MAYDYTSASDLVSWCKEQKNKANAYRLGGIGRYENGVRIFDCVGLIKCFMWHDYSEKNASYYNKEVPDKNETGFFNEATEKGTIDTIPEIPGLMVYQPGHIGVYLGNGEVIEATAAFDKKIVITYFKGNHPDTSYKRTTWTHWFKMPYLNYDVQEETNDEFAHTLGETLRFTTCYRSSTDAAAIRNYIPASQMLRDSGKITRCLKVNGISTYLLDDGLCWVNDGDIAGGSTDSIEIKVGDKVTPASRYSYEGVQLIADVLNHKYSVIEIRGDRVVLGDGLNTAFHSKDIRK